MAKAELDLNGKIRNLQVSISIYKAELKDIAEILADPEEKADLKARKTARIEVINANIDRKEQELAVLKAEKAATKPITPPIVPDPKPATKKKAKKEEVPTTDQF